MLEPRHFSFDDYVPRSEIIESLRSLVEDFRTLDPRIGVEIYRRIERLKICAGNEATEDLEIALHDLETAAATGTTADVGRCRREVLAKLNAFAFRM